jgi:hypothetical protein
VSQARNHNGAAELATCLLLPVSMFATAVASKPVAAILGIIRILIPNLFK